MAQAPGYRELMSWTGAPIMPTPAAVGQIMQTIARRQNINVLGVDIGGATTDVFSVFASIGDDGLSAEPVFNRTVSANLGMSYSISNVLAEATMANVIRWIAIDIEEADLRDRIKNKMIRPTTIPQILEELQIEQGVAREALRLAGSTTAVEAITTEDYPTPAPRPKNSALRNRVLERTIGDHMRPWQEALTAYIP